MSTLDIRSGFQNIQVPPEYQTFMRLVTQDALFVTEHMLWGFNIALENFLKVINYALENPCTDAHSTSIPPAKHATYLDDVTAGDSEEA